MVEPRILLLGRKNLKDHHNEELAMSKCIVNIICRVTFYPHVDLGCLFRCETLFAAILAM